MERPLNLKKLKGSLPLLTQPSLCCKQVVDPYQVGYRGAEHGQAGEVHHEPARLLPPHGQTLRLPARADGGGQLRIPPRAPRLHPGRPPRRLCLLRGEVRDPGQAQTRHVGDV